MSFFKTSEQTNKAPYLVAVPNFVYGPNNLKLEKEHKDKYQYPIEGWYWFETVREAKVTLLSQEEVSLSNSQLQSFINESIIGLNNLFNEFNKLQQDNRKQMFDYFEKDKDFKITHPLIQFIKGAFNLSDEVLTEQFKKYEEII